MAVSPTVLRYFSEYIEAEVGIVYDETNWFQLERRLQQIAQQLGYSGTDELYEKARPRVQPTMRDLLLDVATNNETSFFRDPNTFRALEEHIVPQIRKANPERRSLRIWSAASSTGQEAYSVMMTLEKMRAADPTMPDYHILASDISERVLKRAAEAHYTQLEVQRGLPARQMIQFFERKGEATWAVKPEYKRKIEFRPLNLLGLWSNLPRFDIIFCRNVLIYQSLQNKAKVVRRMQEALVPGGYLVLGGAESLLGVSHELSAELACGGHFYRRKP